MTSPARPDPNHRPLRFALITSGDTIAAWHEEALRRLPASLASVVVRVDVLPAANDPAPARPAGALRGRVADLYRRHRLHRAGRTLEQRPLDEFLDEVPVTRDVLVDRDPHRPALPSSLIEQIDKYECDFAVNMTGMTLDGLPPSVTRYGLWSYRVTTAGVARARHRWVSTSAPRLLEVSLVRVADDPERDTMLQRGWIHSVPHSFAATTDAPHRATVEWLARTCREIVLLGRLPKDDAPARGSTPLRDTDIVRALAGAPLRWLRRLVVAPLRQEEWHVGIVDRPLEEVFRSQDIGRPRWLRNPSPRYYAADPFGIADSETVLVEAYDYVRRTGHIAALHIADDSDRPAATPVMRADSHMSYPYLFEWDGETYCVPETCGQRRATLYRAVRFPDTWESVTVLVEDLAVTDPTIVRHDGMWWLFCTDDDLGSESNLHVYHAAELPGPWRPHALNPVKIDIHSARPAGTPVVIDGKLIRPAQDGSNGYGSAVVFNEIDSLTTESFSEHPVRRLEPDASSRYRYGLHTVSAWGNRTLVDGKRRGLLMMNLLGRARSLVR